MRFNFAARGSPGPGREENELGSFVRSGRVDSSLGHVASHASPPHVDEVNSTGREWRGASIKSRGRSSRRTGRRR
eukprot:31197-Pelagococcus_subviridis.AAC.19